MFTQLVESRRRRDRSLGGTLASAVAHVGVAVLLVIGTANAVVPRHDERVIPLPAIYDQPPPQSDPRPTTTLKRDPAAPNQFKPPTIDIHPLCDCILPTTPSIDGRPLVEGGDFAPRPGSVAPASRTDGRGGSPMESFTVDRMASPLPSNATPRYPEMLRVAAVEGRALFEFVVDTAGRIEPGTIREIASTNALFAQSAREVLRDWRFHPAESNGRIVRVRMQQPFDFRLSR